MPPQRKRIAKIFAWVGGIALTVGITGLLAWQARNRELLIDAPMPVMPSPNARDTFTAASSKYQFKGNVDYAISTEHTSGNPNDHDYTWAQKRAFIAANRATLQTLRQGLAQTYLNPPARSFNALFPYYAQDRALARLLKLEQQVKAQQGDWGGSVNSGLDAMQMGAKIPRGGVVIAKLVGIACEAIGRREIWPAVAHLDARQSRQAASRAQQICDTRVSFTETIQEEEWFGQAGLQEIFRQPNWQKTLTTGASWGSGNPVAPPYQEWGLQIYVTLYGKNAILRNYTNYMDSLRQFAAQRYGAHAKQSQIPNDPICQIVCPVYDNMAISDANCAVQDDLLLLTLCLRAYRLEHGAYPETLAALAPAYLPRLPEDPYAAQGTYRYKTRGASYVLYSVGPDGRDDGGKPIDDSSRATPQHPNNPARYYARRESKGDIVAGINP